MTDTCRMNKVTYSNIFGARWPKAGVPRGSGVQTSSFLPVAMVKERGGMVLSADLEPTEITEIDLSKLHQAARVNLDRYGAFLAPANGALQLVQHVWSMRTSLRRHPSREMLSTTFLTNNVESFRRTSGVTIG